MVVASQLRPGTVLRIGFDLLKVIESSYHLGQGKMPGSVHAKVQNITKHSFKDIRFRPEEKLEDVQLERQDMEFLYSDSDAAVFMNPRTFEQVTVALEAIGPAARYLRTEMTIPVEFFEGAPVSIVFPPVVDAKVDTTAEPIHQQQDNTFKSATLDNGLEILVPQFIRPGETIHVEVATGKYVDRVRTESRRL